MRQPIHILIVAFIVTFISTNFSILANADEMPLKALLVTGGCCHDYDEQRNILPMAVDLNCKVPVEWTILHQRTKGTDNLLEFYKNPAWADGYDVVVHNECFANVGNENYISGILAPHIRGVPAVLIHCTMHSYRTGPAREDWWEFCGAHSPGHGPKHPFEVEVLAKLHPIMKGLENWTTPKGELYFISKTYPGVIPLAQSKSNKTSKMHMNIWAHGYGPKNTRVFATTIGHHNETMLQREYMELFTRGFLWASGRAVTENLKQ